MDLGDDVPFCSFRAVCSGSMLNLHEFTGSESTPISLMNVKDNLWGVLHFGVYSRWNANTWSFLQKMVPEDLAEDAMRWLDEKIPPEGLPI